MAMVTALFALGGCYYLQAARGQLEVLKGRRPFDQVIADPDSPGDLKRRLQMVSEARQFAVDELGLPDNESYRSYTDLGRDFVVWNVIAAPEFSLEPKRWCYPIAGCVPYRGYFSEQQAQREADKLARKGFDVIVGGVPAYSTLGRFADPVLNTMMQWGDEQLVETVFHELAHQLLYIKGDSEFNESFATAVADAGLERWLHARHQTADLDARKRSRTLSRALEELAAAAKQHLATLYASDLATDEMRAGKQRILDQLAEDARRLTATSDTEANWLSGTLNNASLALIGLYEGRVDAFSVMLDRCQNDLACFYQRARALADLDYKERHAELDRLETASATDG